MDLVSDTSAVMAVVLNEPAKQRDAAKEAGVEVIYVEP